MINLRFLLYFPLIFLFLPAFQFHISGTRIFCFIAPFIIVPVLLLVIVKNPNQFYQKIKNVILETPLKFFMIVVGLMLLNVLIQIMLGNLKLGFAIYSVIVFMFLGFLSLLFYLIFIIDKYFSYFKFLKIFILFFWINLILGFVCYTGQLFDLQFITDIFDFFANARILSTKSGLAIDLGASNYFAFGFPRLDNLFEEPGHYAKFLYLFLPLIYFAGNCKYRLYKNKYLNICLKKTIIPFTWLSIILTFSPIFLIYSLIITVLYFHKQLFLFIKKYFIVFISLFLTIIITFSKIDLSETFLSRIINVLSRIKSFEDFILIEPSLATRFVCYINSIIVFIKHPFLGVGYENLITFMKDQMLNSPVPLTPELYKKLSFAIATNSKMYYSTGFIYYILAENGIIIFSIFCYFYYLMIKKIKVILKYIQSPRSLKFQIANMLFWLLICNLLLFIYDYNLRQNTLYIMIALVIMYIYNIKNIREMK